MSDPVVKIPTIKLTPVPGGVNVVQYGTLTIGSVETLEAGSAATVSNSGTIEKAVLDFGIPAGFDGKDGAAATVAIGTVTTGEPGTTASVTNVGTDTAAVLNITIPRGDKGKDGTGAGDVVAAADNTFTATNTFDGTLKTTCDMQLTGSTTTLQRKTANIQSYTLEGSLSKTVIFRDTGDMTGYVKTFIISVIRSGGVGAFSIGTNNEIGSKVPVVYYMNGALPDITDGEVLKIAMEVNEPANAIFIYTLGKVAL